MKLTLFTISNEQIKEQLSKLQMKVESLETVKDVQDKIISAKDSQITFLQGEISSISNWIIFVGSVIIALASAAFIYIRYIEKKATKKIKEAEGTLQSAKDKLTEIETAKQKTETNLTESNEKINQLNSLIDKSNNIATIAQEKLVNLEDKQKELNDLTSITITNQKKDMSIRKISLTLDLSKNIIDTIFEQIEAQKVNLTEEQQKQLSKLNGQYKSTIDGYRVLSFEFHTEVISGQKFDATYIDIGIDRLINRSANLYEECTILRRELDIYE